MNKTKNWKFYYWLLVFTLFLFPITKSFFVNLKNIFESVNSYKNYTSLLKELTNENEKLDSKVEYYKTFQGVKALVKDRLNKVEDGEVIIKFDDASKHLE